MASDSPDKPPGHSKSKRYISKLLERIVSSRHMTANGSFNPEACSDLQSSQAEMISGVLSLSTKNTREIMIPRVDVVAVNSTIPLKNLVKTVYDAGHSRIPVFIDTIDNIAGILYVKDLLKIIIEKPRKFDLKKILHRPYFVPETMTLDDLLVEFKKRQLHLACVVDEYGGFSGIITMEDVLEEIVGEIKDEFDENEQPEFTRINKNTLEVDSRMTISDFNEQTGLALPNDEFDTIGGYVFDLFGKIPKKNETAKHDNLSFKIKDIKGTRINRIIVSILKKDH
ncbi:MAG TPA: HlyC/CorC family transporter [Spirochaetes bacterium]|nr:HlyC/CorC family transporter [Spirochaetota bacterium]